MIALTLLKLYFELNCVLCTAWILYSVGRRIESRAKLNLKHGQWVFLARSLVIVSLLAPCLFSALPERTLPALTFSAGTEPQDLITARRARQHRRVGRNNAAWVTAPASSMRLMRAVPWKESAPRILLLLGVLFMIPALRLGREFLKLLKLLNSSLILRRSGLLKVVASDHIAVPFSAYVLGRSWVALPVSLILSERDFRLALRHELQHHRQGDARWAVLLELLVCFLFLNPAAYRWRREITELEEFSCDEALTGRRRVSPHEYGSCLVRVAETALGARSIPVGTACMATVSGNPKNKKTNAYAKSFLRRRIEMFTASTSSRPKPLPRIRLGIALGTVIATLTFAAAFGSQQVLHSPDPLQINPGRPDVDPAIQKIADRIIRAALVKQGAKSAFAIVSDPNSGRVLAVANASVDARPEYWSLSTLTEPASLSKALILATAVENRETALDEVFDCENGNYTYGKQVYHDWKPFDHLTAEQTVIQSSNICGIKIGERLTPDGLDRMLTNFGFGPGGSSAAFPAARPGRLPPVDETPGSPYVPLISTGFDFRTSVLEIQQAFGAIANGGYLMKPQPASAPQGSGVVIRRVLSQETAREMRRVLAEVVTEGTGQPVASSLYTSAGKTATAYSPSSPEHEKLGGFLSTGTFVGFAPVNNPQIEVYVGVNEPADGKPTGSRHAGPVFKEIVDEVLQSMGVPPDKAK